MLQCAFDFSWPRLFFILNDSRGHIGSKSLSSPTVYELGRYGRGWEVHWKDHWVTVYVWCSMGFSQMRWFNGIPGWHISDTIAGYSGSQQLVVGWLDDTNGCTNPASSRFSRVASPIRCPRRNRRCLAPSRLKMGTTATGTLAMRTFRVKQTRTGGKGMESPKNEMNMQGLWHSSLNASWFCWFTQCDMWSDINYNSIWIRTQLKCAWKTCQIYRRCSCTRKVKSLKVLRNSLLPVATLKNPKHI